MLTKKQFEEIKQGTSEYNGVTVDELIETLEEMEKVIGSVRTECINEESDWRESGDIIRNIVYDFLAKYEGED